MQQKRLNSYQHFTELMKDPKELYDLIMSIQSECYGYINANKFLSKQLFILKERLNVVTLICSNIDYNGGNEYDN